eukprot:gene24880-30059_t
MKRTFDSLRDPADHLTGAGLEENAQRRSKGLSDPLDVTALLQIGKDQAEKEYNDLLVKYLEFIKLLRAEFGDAFGVIIDCVFLLLQAYLVQSASSPELEINDLFFLLPDETHVPIVDNMKMWLRASQALHAYYLLFLTGLVAEDLKTDSVPADETLRQEIIPYPHLAHLLVRTIPDTAIHPPDIMNLHLPPLFATPLPTSTCRHLLRRWSQCWNLRSEVTTGVESSFIYMGRPLHLQTQSSLVDLLKEAIGGEWKQWKQGEDQSVEEVKKVVYKDEKSGEDKELTSAEVAEKVKNYLAGLDNYAGAREKILPIITALQTAYFSPDYYDSLVTSECRRINSNVPPLAFSLRGIVRTIFPTPRKVVATTRPAIPTSHAVQSHRISTHTSPAAAQAKPANLTPSTNAHAQQAAQAASSSHSSKAAAPSVVVVASPSTVLTPDRTTSSSKSSSTHSSAKPTPLVPSASQQPPAKSTGVSVDTSDIGGVNMEVEEPMSTTSPSTSSASMVLAKEFLEKMAGYPFNAYPPNTQTLLQQALQQVISHKNFPKPHPDLKGIAEGLGIRGEILALWVHRLTVYVTEKAKHQLQAHAA